MTCHAFDTLVKIHNPFTINPLTHETKELHVSTIKYNLSHLTETDENSSKFFISSISIHRGEVICLDDDSYFCVVAVLHKAPITESQGEPPILVLSKPATSLEEAMKHSIQYNHLPEDFWPYLSKQHLKIKNY